MASINPLQIFIFPFVFLFALPLALCAGVTTVLAFFVLFLRLFFAYFDVGLETLRYLILGAGARNRYIAWQRAASPTPLSPSRPSQPSSPAESSPRQLRQRRKRRGSLSSGTVTPSGLDGMALTPSLGLERDFEGVGGWRLDSINIGGDASAGDEQWYSLNSRLEIPEQRHHFRSSSGGAVLSGASSAGVYMNTGAKREGSQSPERLRMTTSPNSSRSRTPTGARPYAFTRLDDEGYFPPYDTKHSKKISV